MSRFAFCLHTIIASALVVVGCIILAIGHGAGLFIAAMSVIYVEVVRERFFRG